VRSSIVEGNCGSRFRKSTCRRATLPRIEASLWRRFPAVLDSAEASGNVHVKVDREGDAKAVESKTRLIAPGISAFNCG